MRFSGLIFILLCVNLCIGQKVSDQQRQAILKEGIALYKLELASWHASELLDRMVGIHTLDSIGGFVSYRQGEKFNTIYYGEANPGVIYAHFVFDSLCSIESALLDMTPRNAGTLESALISMREDALGRIEKNDDNFFETFPNVEFNIVPVIADNLRRVFILSAGGADDEIILGNDYLMTYSSDNRLLSRKKLHSGLVPLPLDTETGHPSGSSHIHKGAESSRITSTDICTLLLYADYVSWTRHFVHSPQLVSIFDMENQTLQVVTRKEFEKMKAH